MCVYIYVYLYIFFIYIYVYIFMCIYIYIYLYIYIHTRTYIYIYTHTHLCVKPFEVESVLTYKDMHCLRSNIEVGLVRLYYSTLHRHMNKCACVVCGFLFGLTSWF